MDLYKVFLKWGIPRDIIGIIDTFVRCNMVPHKIIITQTSIPSVAALNRGSFKNIVIYGSGCRDGCDCYDMNTGEIGSPVKKTSIKLLSETEYLSYDEFVQRTNLRTGEVSTDDFTGIVGERILVSQKDGDISRKMVHPTDMVYYLPSAGVFAMQYKPSYGDTIELLDKMLFTGTSLIKNPIPMEPDMLQWTLISDRYMCDLWSNFAIIHYYMAFQIIFRDGIIIHADDAVKFDEDSVVFMRNKKYYYRHVGCEQQELPRLTGIDLQTVYKYENRIAFRSSVDNHIHFGDIEWQ